jgi:hypothetical protein
MSRYTRKRKKKRTTTKGKSSSRKQSGSKTVTISKRGKKPIKFKRGALHRQLGVPEGQPIPESKKRAALAGKYGPLARKRAIFAFKGALKKGRQTARKK